MPNTLDDIYREVIWKTNLSTTDLPYIYASGGAFGFLQLFANTYKYLVNEVVLTDSDYFLNRFTDNFVANQEVYYLPADLIKLKHIEFSFDGNGFWPGTEIKTNFFRAGSEQRTVSAASMTHPFFWIGDSITAPSSPYHVAPRPLAAVTSGILMYYDQMPSALFSVHISSAVSAASAAVYYPSQFEYLIPLGVSVELWGKYGQRAEKSDEIQRYQKGIEDMKLMMKPRVATGQKRVRDSRELITRDY